MEILGQLFSAIMEGMQYPLNIYGHEISLWQVFVFAVIGGLLCELIGGFFSGK